MPVANAYEHVNGRLIDLLRHMIELDQGEGHLQTTVDQQVSATQEKDFHAPIAIIALVTLEHDYPTPSYRGSSFTTSALLPTTLRDVRVLRGPPMA